MKVAVVHGPGDLRLDDAQRPVARAGDIVTGKVAAAGICGSDLHYPRHGSAGTPTSPMPLGHEFAGEMFEVGPKPNVKNFKVGDRVAYNSYNSPADMGRGGECGGFTPYVALREVDGHVQSLCRVPAEVSLEHAALVEPISVGAHAVNRADPKPGESVTIFGVGPIGLGIIMALRARGVEDIVAFDLSPLRRERAKALGAWAAFDPRERKPGGSAERAARHRQTVRHGVSEDRYLLRSKRRQGHAVRPCQHLQQRQPHRHFGHATASGDARRHAHHEQGGLRSSVRPATPANFQR